MRRTMIVVDDEVHIRKGLAKLIANHASQWELIGEARDGEEGLELILRLQPDLAIVDVRMQVMNGIELAEQVQRKELATRIVILTGYKDFEYAQAAVRFGVVEFLLKPSRQAEIVRVLDSVYDKLQSERSRSSMNRQFMLESGIRSLFMGLPVIDELRDTINQVMLDRECWLITGFLNDRGKIDNTSLLQFALKNIIEETYGQEGMTATYVPIQYNVSALFVSRDKPASDTVAVRLQETVKGLLDIELKLHRTKAALKPEEYAVLLKSAVAPLGLTVTQPEEHAAEDIYGLQEDWVYLVTDGRIDQLKEQIRSQMVNIISDAHSIGDIKNRSVMLLIVLQSINRRALRLPDTPIERDKRHIAGLRSTEEVTEFLAARIEHFIEQLDRWLASNNQNMVQKAVQYIDEQYMHSCSLSDVAAHVHCNPAYLSDLFKRETGEGFIKYVTGVRIEQAKILLKNTDLKIVEISRRVGYDDPNYFTTIFSRMNACSPIQYRKR